jgi:hypothetical protein
VVTKPLRAILPSMIAFVATVVAWTTSPTSPAERSPSTRSNARMKPSDGSAGVVRTFEIATAPVRSSIAVPSVNVPPMSIATRRLIGTLSARIGRCGAPSPAIG